MNPPDRYTQQLNAAFKRVDNAFEAAGKALDAAAKQMDKAPPPPNMEPNEQPVMRLVTRKCKWGRLGLFLKYQWLSLCGLWNGEVVQYIQKKSK
jgi:hypothetical protein